MSDHLKVGFQNLCLLHAKLKNLEAMDADKPQQQIFGDRSITIEDLMRQKGQLVKRGTLGGNEDIEFWDDGTQTEYNKSKLSQ